MCHCYAEHLIGGSRPTAKGQRLFYILLALLAFLPSATFFYQNKEESEGGVAGFVLLALPAFLSSATFFYQNKEEGDVSGPSARSTTESVGKFVSWLNLKVRK